jgi:hypothetical protein
MLKRRRWMMLGSISMQSLCIFNKACT